MIPFLIPTSELIVVATGTQACLGMGRQVLKALLMAAAGSAGSAGGQLAIDRLRHNLEKADKKGRKWRKKR